MKKNLSKVAVYLDGGLNHFIKTTVSGLFWLAPIAAMAMIILWLYGKADFVAGKLFHILGIVPLHYPVLWTLVGISILVLSSFLVGHFIETRIGSWVKNGLEYVLTRIPGYKLIRDLIGLFNSSKAGNSKVLVVMIKGFSSTGYNIGLMYSTEESYLKDYYSVVLSQTPIPNGGYIFEEHSDNIWMLEELTFNHNLVYLLSLGSKSIASIAGIKPRDISELVTLTDWLAKNKKDWRFFCRKKSANRRIFIFLLILLI